MTDDFAILIIITIAGIVFIFTGFILLQVRSQNKILQKQKLLAAVEVMHQKALLQSVITSQEAERQRIGNDLHDEVGSVLSSLRMLIEKQYDKNEAPGEAAFLKQSKEMIDGVIKNARQISHNLSPYINGNYGFYDALHGLSDTINAAGTILVTINFTEQQMPANLNSDTAMALYRVMAELINNSIKHAKTNNIYIDINNSGSKMHIHYADDGIGFTYPDVAVKGMGLRNIESRLIMIHANWNFDNAKTKGCCVNISIPLS